ncbi:MAG: hypothetical protein Q9211_005278 [Gyalolechia sp. 1 TL-2023]
MSAEDDQGIAFSIAHDPQRYRLLELSPPLLDLLSSTDPPGQTFQLRQVHISNSVFVLQPAKDGSLTAVSKCEATLEAIPQSPPCISLLKAALPVHSDEEQPIGPTSSKSQSKQSVLVDTPVSSQEFNRAWVDLCAFELEGRAWIPTSSLLWKVWRSIISASTIKGLPLDKALDVQSLASMVEGDEIHIPAFNAIIERLQDEKSAGQARTLRLSHRHGKVAKAH